MTSKDHLRRALFTWNRFKDEPSAWTAEGLVVIASLFASAVQSLLDEQDGVSEQNDE